MAHIGPMFCHDGSSGVIKASLSGFLVALVSHLILSILYELPGAVAIQSNCFLRLSARGALFLSGAMTILHHDRDAAEASDMMLASNMRTCYSIYHR